MEPVKNISLGILHGLWDSISGMTLILHIDNEIHRLNAEQEAEKHRRRRRSPSPVPSSAAAMARENLLQQLEEEGAEERSLESIRKKKQKVEGAPKPEKKIAKQVLKCCVLNGGFTWLSIILFEQLLLPTLKMIITWCYGPNSSDLPIAWSWVQSILSIVFGMMWVLPMFLLSKIVSSLWFADIANAAYRVRKGKPQMIPNISKLVADFLFSLVVQALFLVQSMLVNLVPLPYVGSSMCFVHLCLLYSLYCFEYKWFNMGWELHRRLTYIENNWPYFLGFGIPLTVLTNMSSSVIVSSCIFSIFFPLFILSGNEAKPLVGTTETPLRLFSPVIFFSNLFFNRGRKRTPAPRAQPKKVAAAAEPPLSAYQQEMQFMQEQIAREKKLRQLEKLKRQQHQELQHNDDRDREFDRRSSSSSLNSQPTYRYQQPPLPVHRRTSPAGAPRHSVHFRSSPLRNITPERDPPYMRPLIPTPVAGAPEPPARNR